MQTNETGKTRQYRKEKTASESVGGRKETGKATSVSEGKNCK